jgi:hypothetical protein
MDARQRRRFCERFAGRRPGRPDRRRADHVAEAGRVVTRAKPPARFAFNLTESHFARRTIQHRFATPLTSGGTWDTRLDLNQA